MNDVIEALESLDDKVERIEHKINQLNREDKSHILFIPLGVVLMALGLLGISYVYALRLTPLFNVIWGFLLTLSFFSGFALMHKSLRGAWL